MEYEHDGHTYQIKRLGLSDAKECLAQLNTMGFFDNGLEALIGSPDELNQLERRDFLFSHQLRLCSSVHKRSLVNDSHRSTPI